MLRLVGNCRGSIRGLEQDQAALCRPNMTDVGSLSAQLPPGQVALVVEMNRSRGDPVLLRKPAAAGVQAGALPSVLVSCHTCLSGRCFWTRLCGV